MKDVGIMDGDVVLVERTTNYKAGDIVVVEVDEEWTVKFLRKSHKGFYLEPANKDYSPYLSGVAPQCSGCGKG